METKLIKIDQKDYIVNTNEFSKIEHIQYHNLNIYSDLELYERLYSLINELSLLFYKPSLLCFNITHGGFIPLNCSEYFHEIFINESNNFLNVVQNMIKNKITNIVLHFDICNPSIVFSEQNIDTDKYKNSIIIIQKHDIKHKHIYKLSNTNYYIYIPDNLFNSFYSEFCYYINDNILDYNNLVHYCMIVKNAGDTFETVLKENLDVIDKWTILDTGSTDNTIEIINKVLVSKKKGNLYQEPFVDFKTSRNRCLELVGKSCKFIMMLDDTYVIKGDLKKFLNEIRGDQFSDSFSLYIKSKDTEYVSNRIIKSNRNLRYIYKIHEIINPNNNNNVLIPIDKAFIFDYDSDYMQERTFIRKEYDLKILFQEFEENPQEPRHLYYIGLTYNLLHKYDLAYEYLLKRANHPVEGYVQERMDAIIEAARIANFKLNKPWEKTKKLYEWAYELDKTRPEPFYFIGINYYLKDTNEDKKIAFDYFKKVFEIGYPINSQYNLKPSLSYHFLPKMLTSLCYQFDDFTLGEKVSQFFLSNNKKTDDSYEIILSWYNIFKLLNSRSIFQNKKQTDKPIFCIISDGGFKKWSGSSIENNGVGGSETWAIETATYLKKYLDYNVIVFCNCEKFEIYKNVEYRPLNEFFSISIEYDIEHCMISRFSEYIPVAIHSNVKNIYFILHDLLPSGLVIPIHPKLKKIYCLTEWHKSYFLNIFPQFKEITEISSYGINNNSILKQKIKNSFIYSSYPNRGLIHILQNWDYIKNKIPDATLHIYCDLFNEWSNTHFPQMMKDIQELYEKYKNNGVINHGWVNKKILFEGWSKCEYWLYPCIFKETFCLTAHEAAITKTLCITNKLAGLEYTIGDRGIYIEDKLLEEKPDTWIQYAINKILNLNEYEKNILLDKNYHFVIDKTWNNITLKLLNSIIPDKNITNNKFIKDFYNKHWKECEEFCSYNNFLDEKYVFSVLEKNKNILPSFQNDETYVSIILDDNYSENNTVVISIIKYFTKLGYTVKIFNNLNINEFIDFSLKYYNFRVIIFGHSPFYLYSYNNQYIDYTYIILQETEKEKYKISINDLKIKFIEIQNLDCNEVFTDLFEYKGMFNWTNDLPLNQNSYNNFIEIIDYFNNKNIKNPKVLEIGTYTGVSIINILKQIPNSQGTVIDLWENYDENILLNNINHSKIFHSFQNNIKKYNMNHRITLIKDFSLNALKKMIKDNHKYDFIYVDGSHTYEDCLNDLFLSWELLNENGILAIDDYTYNVDKDIQLSPYEAVNKFLSEKQSEFNLLKKNYRVFLEKKINTNKNIKIFMIGTHPSQTTGYSKVVYNICKQVSSYQNIELILFGIQNFHNLNESERKDIPSNVTIHDVYKYDKTDFGFGSNSLKEVLLKHNPDVILIYNDPEVVKKYILNIELIKKSNEYKNLNKNKLPIFVYLDQVHKNITFDTIEYINKNSQHIFCFTEDWKNNLQNYFYKKQVDINKDKFSVIRHGIDNNTLYDQSIKKLKEKYGFSADSFIFLNLNRYLNKKKLDISIIAFVHFLKKSNSKNAYLYFPAIFESEVNTLYNIYYHELENNNLSFDVFKNNFVIGNKILTDSIIHEIYYISDVGINSCDGEGFGLCNYEHASYGKPQIISNVGGLKDFFNNNNSLLCEPQYISYSLNNEKGEVISFKDMGDNMYTYFTDKKIYQKHSNILKNIPNIYRWDIEIKNMFNKMIELL